MGTGFKFLHKELNEFEWNAKSVRNKISGLYSRQFNSRQRPSAEHLEKFRQMMSRFMKYYQSKLDLADSGLAEFDPFEDIMARSDFDRAKK